jgi:hypothetical protein
MIVLTAQLRHGVTVETEQTDDEKYTIRVYKMVEENTLTVIACINGLSESQVVFRFRSIVSELSDNAS